MQRMFVRLTSYLAWHHGYMRWTVQTSLRWAAIAVTVLAAFISTMYASTGREPTTHADVAARQQTLTRSAPARLLEVAARREVPPARHVKHKRHSARKHPAGQRRGSGSGSGPRHSAPGHQVTLKPSATIALPPQDLVIVEPAGPAPAARLPFFHVALAQALITRPTRRDPWFVRIPSIGVDARLMVLGYPHNANLPVPPLSAAFRVGWYSFTAVPGRAGNVVLVGHVDTYLGPAVFYDLYLLRPGDRIEVRLSSHRYARYTVRSIREMSKADFPTTEVFSDTHAKRLWLITCGGPFDYATRHYTENIVVSASQ